jgi:hypothetical protein
MFTFWNYSYFEKQEKGKSHQNKKKEQKARKPVVKQNRKLTLKTKKIVKPKNTDKTFRKTSCIGIKRSWHGEWGATSG